LDQTIALRFKEESILKKILLIICETTALSLMAALAGAPLAQAQSYTVLHSFTGWADGANAHAGLIRDAAGNLYGTTSYGGAGQNGGCPYQLSLGCGIVFRLDPAGNETVYPFTGANGAVPMASLILDSAGNLYGTTCDGGTSDGGVVFKLDPSGTETVLYSFTGGTDGGCPEAGLIRDSAGNLFSTASRGGTANQGVVFQLDPAGVETVLYSFTGEADGGDPEGLVRDSAGNFYGTTFTGGISRDACLGHTCGVIFKLSPSGKITVLYSFTGGTDGGNPAGVVRDPAGNLYGTAEAGGATTGACATGLRHPGCGVVFKLDTAGREIVLHTFTGGADGAYPFAGLIRDSAGNLYGTTLNGGTADDGVVYELDAAANETVLYSFAGGASGGGPLSVLIRDPTGNLYGTASGGGVYNNSCSGGCGVVFKLAP
jgi:uncharacterized repeat protein (TIGR03803 family)